jgi:regulator of protease activity HflC (stomatin/prohibitin superfamily)
MYLSFSFLAPLSFFLSLFDVPKNDFFKVIRGFLLHFFFLHFFSSYLLPLPSLSLPPKSQDEITTQISTSSSDSCCCYLCAGLCCLIPIVGCCCVMSKTVLVDQGSIGLSMNNGNPEVLKEGRHFMMNPLQVFVGTYSFSMQSTVPQFNNKIYPLGEGKDCPISIVRVNEGEFGLARNGTFVEILLPGTHFRTSASFTHHRNIPMETEFEDFYSVKLVTVRSGTVNLAYSNGKAVILPAGRYCITDPTFQIKNDKASIISISQQFVRFVHPVLLAGGVCLIVEGLLTYQVTDLQTLIHQLGSQDLSEKIQNPTKAELARVFATVHLEDISRVSTAQSDQQKGISGSHEGEVRSRICGEIVKGVRPIISQWGCSVINFQLENTRIADKNYATDYERSSLANAQALANLRAVDAENEILMKRSQAEAESKRIDAEGRKIATVLSAEAEAEARQIDGDSRNKAAVAMSDSFSKQYAMAGQQVEFAKALSASSITLLSDAPLAQAFVQNRMLNASQKK